MWTVCSFLGRYVHVTESGDGGADQFAEAGIPCVCQGKRNGVKPGRRGAVLRLRGDRRFGLLFMQAVEAAVRAITINVIKI